MTEQKPFDLQDLKNSGYEIFILLVSVLSVANLIVMFVSGLDSDSVRVVQVINFFLTVIFLLDFSSRLLSAGSKGHYFFRDWGWADLLAVFLRCGSCGCFGSSRRTVSSKSSAQRTCSAS